MKKFIRDKYDIGDIVFVNEYEYSESKIGDNHLFVIIGDDAEAVPLEYFGLIISSRLEKSKENSEFKFNEPLYKNVTNNLKYDSIVKCDSLFKIPKSNILFKIGTVDIDDFLRFINTYNDYLSKIDKKTEDVSFNI